MWLISIQTDWIKIVHYGDETVGIQDERRKAVKQKSVVEKNRFQSTTSQNSHRKSKPAI